MNTLCSDQYHDLQVLFRHHYVQKYTVFRILYRTVHVNYGNKIQMENLLYYNWLITKSYIALVQSEFLPRDAMLARY